MAQWKRQVLDTVAEHIQIDKANFISQHNHEPPVQLTKNTPIRNDIAYQEHYYALDPLGFMSNGEVGLTLTQGPKSGAKIVSLDDVVDRASFQKSEYYNEFLRPLQIYHEVIVYLQAGHRILGILSVMRNPSRAFAPGEIELLRLLEPYLSMSFDNLIIRYENTRFNSNPTTASPVVEWQKIRSRFKLTQREAEVIDGIIRGMTNARIAEELFIAETTVKKHIQNICAKMSLNSRTAIIYNIMKLSGFI